MGALTAKPYTFNARPWELRYSFVIDFFDGHGNMLCVDSRGLEILRVRPFVSNATNEWISDKARFAFDAYNRQRLITPTFSRMILLKSMIFLPTTGWFFILNHIYKRYWGTALRSLLVSYSTGSFYKGVFSFSLLSSFLDLEFLSVVGGYFRKLFTFSSFDLSSTLSDFSFLHLMQLKDLETMGLALFFGLNSRLEMPSFHLKVRQALLRRGLLLLNFGLSIQEASVSFYNIGFSFVVLLALFSGNLKYAKLFFKQKEIGFFVGQTAYKRLDSVVALLKSGFSFLNSFFRLSWHFVSADLALVGALNLSLVNKGFGGNVFFSTHRDFFYTFGLDEVYWTGTKSLFDAKSALNIASFSPYISQNGFFGFPLRRDRFKMLLPLAHPFEKKSSFLTSEGFFRVSDYVLSAKTDVRVDWMIFASLGFFLNLFTPSLFSLFIRRAFVRLRQNFASLSSFYVLLDSFVKFNGSLVNSSFFLPLFEHFYITDVISRNSYSMGLCVLRSKWSVFRYNFPV